MSHTLCLHSIALKNISCVYFIIHIIQALVVAVCDDSVAHFLELIQIVDNQTAKEGIAIFQGRLIDDHSCTLCLDALHDTLNGTLTEVIAVALHGQTVHADGHRLLLLLIVFIVLVIAVVASQFQDAISNEVLSGSITLNNSFNQVLRHICIVSQQLLGILRQAVAAGRCQVLDNIFHK